ncbi:MAG: hypothetical protein FWE93_01160 [Alphaproteobacteria bacterium]|nr:hypothetical protein [Alphaproteobacteria bacterium]
MAALQEAKSAAQTDYVIEFNGKQVASSCIPAIMQRMQHQGKPSRPASYSGYMAGYGRCTVTRSSKTARQQRGYG